MKIVKASLLACSLIGLGVGIFFCQFSEAEQSQSARSARLAERFHFFCLQSLPDFIAISKRSTALGLQVKDDQDLPLGNGDNIQMKNWIVPDVTGEWVLLSSKREGPKRQESCGLSAPDADGKELTLALSKDPMLGDPVRQNLDNPQHYKTILWDAHFGTDTALLMLLYDAKDIRGVSMYLQYPKRGN